MIDEKKLIEAFCASMNTGKESFPVDIIIECIEEQQKVGEWIPVSENKPQKQFSNNTIIKFYLVSTKRGNVRLGFRDEDGEWLTEHGNIIPKVIAWMPLPEAYKE